MTKRSFHIALVSAEYPPQPGGIGDYTQQLGQALAARDHVVTVITGGGDARLDFGEGPVLPVHRLPIRAWGWGSWRAMIAALGCIQPDVVHIQYQTGAYGMHPAINLLPWRLRSLSSRLRIVVTMHDLLVPYLFPKAGVLRRWVTRRLLCDADAVVVTNQADLDVVTRSRSARLIPIGSNIAPVPPSGYDRGVWRSEVGVAEGEVLIGYFGLLSRSKGLDVLLAALASLPEHFRLLVVGGAVTSAVDRAFADEVQQQIRAMGLEQRVLFTGHCLPTEVSANLLAIDIAALPFTDGASFRRGSLLAMLGHGIPTVTTGVSGSTPLLDGVHALLVPPQDAVALAAAIVRLAEDVPLCVRLRQGAQVLASGFSWDAIALQHELFYIHGHTFRAMPMPQRASPG